MCARACACPCSVMSDLVTPWTVAHLPGSSVHGIFQAQILEWVAIFSSRGFSPSRDQTPVSHTSPALQADSLPLSHQGSLLASYVLSKGLVNEGVYTTFSGKCRALCIQSLPAPGPSGLCSHVFNYSLTLGWVFRERGHHPAPRGACNFLLYLILASPPVRNLPRPPPQPPSSISLGNVAPLWRDLVGCHSSSDEPYRVIPKICLFKKEEEKLANLLLSGHKLLWL